MKFLKILIFTIFGNNGKRTFSEKKGKREFSRPRITLEPTDKIAKWDETSK